MVCHCFALEHKRYRICTLRKDETFIADCWSQRKERRQSPKSLVNLQEGEWLTFSKPAGSACDSSMPFKSPNPLLALLSIGIMSWRWQAHKAVKQVDNILLTKQKNNFKERILESSDIHYK